MALLKYSVWETKTKLSEILRQVQSGKIVTINQRGVPVAQIVPFEEKRDSTLEQRLESLRKQGHLQLGRLSLSTVKPLRRKGALARFLQDR
jgi:prevent-host-death family protein